MPFFKSCGFLTSIAEGNVGILGISEDSKEGEVLLGSSCLLVSDISVFYSYIERLGIIQ